MVGKTHSDLGRRGFLKSAAATAAGVMVLKSGSALGSEANSKLQLGIIGCGGRGPWLGNLFQQHSNTKVVAVHDPFRDRVRMAGQRLEVDPSRQYVGLDGYRELIASDVDAVAIISPPYFHPEQTVAALDAGKHIFVAKPIAVDVPGCTVMVEAAKKAEGRLTSLVDFQTRTDPFYREAIRRVHEGLIGRPVMGQSYYYANRLGIKAEPGTPGARLRNWTFDIALSGDIIVEQNIHVLDVANWILQGHPIKASGTGGRQVRTDVGDCWDHFIVTYWYPNDVLIDFSSAQFVHAFQDLCTRIHCETGSLDTHYGGDIVLEGKSEVYRPGATSQIYQQGAVANIIDFHKSIMNGTPINNMEESARSTMTSILGRMAAYTGRVVTWDEMVAANERLEADLELPTEAIEG